MEKSPASSLVIAGGADAAPRTAIGTTIAPVDRLGQVVTDADRPPRSTGRLGGAVARAETPKAETPEAAADAPTRPAQRVGAVYNAVKTPLTQNGDFEHRLRAFGNRAGITGQELEEVRRQIRAVSTEVNQPTEAILGGIDILVGKGMGAKEALEASRAIGRAATASGASVEDVSRLAASLVTTLHVPVEKLGRAFDIMAEAGKAGGLDLKAMARPFPRAATAAARLGLTGIESVASLSAQFQVAARDGRDPDAAAETLAHVLSGLTSPETKQAFQTRGIDIEQALADGVAAGGNPVEVAMQQIAAATGVDLDKAMADSFDANGRLVAGAADRIRTSFRLGDVFGDAADRDFLAPLLTDYGAYLSIKQRAAQASGIIDRDFAAMIGTYAEADKKMGLAVDSLIGSIGKAASPFATPVVNTAADRVNALADWAETSPNAALAVTGLAGAAGAGLAFRGGLGMARRESPGLGRAVRFGAKALGGAGLALGAGLAVGDLLDPTLPAEKKGAAGGSLAGGLAGAVGGAVLGSAVPVIGTALGAILGGVLGSFGGEALGGWLGRDKAAEGRPRHAAPPGEPPGETPVWPADPIGRADSVPRSVCVSFAPGSIVVNAPPGIDLYALADQVAQMIMQRQRAALAD